MKLFCITCLTLSALSMVPAMESYAAPKVPAPQQSYDTIPNVRSIYQPILPTLKVRTQVPLVLPTYISGHLTTGKFYATLLTAEPTQYTVIIGSTRPCEGGTYCRLGTIEGKQITSSTPSIQEEYAFINDPDYTPTDRSSDKMGPVKLANGITGYYVPYVCGANCDDAKVLWEQGGYRYLVGMKAGEKREVVDMANSAIKGVTKR